MKYKQMKTYTIEVNEEQLRAISEACEFTSRFMAGQMEATYWPFSMGYKIDPDVRRTVDAYVHNIKELALGLSPHSSNGYGFDKTSDMLFEAYQTIRHAMWLELDDSDKEKTRMTVSADPPVLNASGVPFPKVKPNEPEKP